MDKKINAARRSASAKKAWVTKRENGFDGIGRGEKSPLYKMGKISYSAIHAWIRKTLGTPSNCQNCGTTTAKKFEWANISKEYKREISDWVRLCVKCHDIYDDIYNKRPRDMYERMWETRRNK